MTDRPRRLHVMVLMGGSSSEREISLSTGRQILSALDPDRYEVSAIDTRELLQLTHGSGVGAAGVLEGDRRQGIDRSDVGAPLAAPQSAASDAASLPDALVQREDHAPTPNSRRPDLVFIALHGKGGEDGSVQGMLDLIGLPYTGSGVLASALAMNKSMTKRLLRGDGIEVIEEVLVRRGALPAPDLLISRVEQEIGGFPVFVKPNAEGSTVGGTLVETPDALTPAVELALRYDPIALIERYVRGMEITIGVLGNAGEEIEALPVVEIVPRAAFYDFESKYADGGSDHIIPARLSEERRDEAQQIARRCHELLGCRGMSRTDLIATADRLYVLEVNTIPGMTPTSLLPQAAAHAGVSFTELLDRLVRLALPHEDQQEGALT